MPAPCYAAFSRASAVPGALIALLVVAHAAPDAPLDIRDTRTDHHWTLTRAQGGGVVFTLEPGPASLYGAGFRLRLGCDSFEPSRSRWAFKVEVSAPAGDLDGAQERAFDQAVRRAFAAPGEVILMDELDKPFRRFPLKPDHAGLTTAALAAEDIPAFSDASSLRIETPYLRLEAGLHGLHQTLVVAKPRLACRPD